MVRDCHHGCTGSTCLFIFTIGYACNLKIRPWTSVQDIYAVKRLLTTLGWGHQRAELKRRRPACWAHKRFRSSSHTLVSTLVVSSFKPQNTSGESRQECLNSLKLPDQRFGMCKSLQFHHIHFCCSLGLRHKKWFGAPHSTYVKVNRTAQHRIYRWNHNIKKGFAFLFPICKTYQTSGVQNHCSWLTWLSYGL